MRGDVFNTGISPSPDEIVAPSSAATAAAPAAPGSNVDDNMQLAKQPGSVYWLLLLAALYGIYYWMYNVKWKEAVNTSALLAFLHNALSITILATVGVNLINVFLTKLAALKIPVISKTAGTFLPLFHL